MSTLSTGANRMMSRLPVRGWLGWAPHAAVAWSLLYAALGLYWALSGQGFPYARASVADPMGPLLGRLRPEVAWIVVLLAGIPAAVLGTVMLRGERALRPVWITAGGLLSGVLLLLMTDLTLLITLGYIPFSLVQLLVGSEFGRSFFLSLIQGPFLQKLLCLLGGFLWLGATLSYARRSGEACPACGRREGPGGWTSPENARRWGRIAVGVGLLAPVIYAFTRYAWALGIPLGMSKAYWQSGQERGEWVSGLFLATFGLVGGFLMLGLVQRWGEVFPRWMIGLGGRRVPIALAVVPAALVSVLLVVGGISIFFSYSLMAQNAAATGQEVAIVVGPTLLFPIWGVALAVATLGYYYRRRDPCQICGRGEPDEVGRSLAS